MKRTKAPGTSGNSKPRTKISGEQRRKIFVQEYLIDFNVTRAAKAAGYAERSAHVTGHNLLKDPKVQKAIQKAIDERSERTKVTQDRVVKELAKIAFADMRNFARWNAHGVDLIESRLLSDEDAACISEVSQVDTQYGSNIRIKLHDKMKALDALGRHLGMFIENHNHRVSGEDGGPIEVSHEFSDEAIKTAFDALYNSGKKSEPKKAG